MNRRGFTVIEVMLAVIIMSVVALSLGRVLGTFHHTVAVANLRTTASSVAQERMEEVRAFNSPLQYPTLVAQFNATTTTGFPGYPNMVRTTRVVRAQTVAPAPVTDVTTITVTVSEPTLAQPVSYTTVVANPT